MIGATASSLCLGVLVVKISFPMLVTRNCPSELIITPGSDRLPLHDFDRTEIRVVIAWDSEVCSFSDGERVRVLNREITDESGVPMQREVESITWAGKALQDFVCHPLGEAGILVHFLGLVLDNVYNGIIVCDRNCRIVFMNQVYADLLKTDREQALGKPIQEFFPRSRLPSVMKKGKAELGQRCSLKTETVLLVNRIPLKREGRVTGVILQTIFRDYKSFTDLIGKMNLLEHEVKYQRRALDSVLSPKYSVDSIIGRSKVIEDAKVLAMKYARTDAPVLILGATGTGKELFAHAVHTGSLRSEGPFVCLNCAGIPRDLLESELFGYEPGAFTGARKEGKPGQIQLAHHGTLYLDEIGELPLNAQAKLLRLLENKTLTRVGAVKPIPVDFRLVAATNRDLNEMIVRGNFREDLYYRLNAMTVKIPPLSERTDDIPILVRHFLSTSGKSNVQVGTRQWAYSRATSGQAISAN